MPYKRKTYGTRTRREAKRGFRPTDRMGPLTRRQAYGSIRVPRHTTPFPPQYKIKLVYTGWVHDALAGNGTTSNSAYTFKLNSCYDPYDGVSGAYNIQPYFWDQISAIYKRYLVTSAKVEYQVNTPASNAMVVLRPTTVSTSPSDFQLEESRPYATKRMVSGVGQPVKIKRYYPVYKIHGVSPNKVKNDDLFASTIGADPTLLMYLHVIQQNVTTAITSNSMPFNIKITQYVTMFDRTIVSAS